MKRFSVIAAGLCLGLLVGFIIKIYFKQLPVQIFTSPIPQSEAVSTQVVGFLPYWLLTNAKKDYSSYITTLTYFGLRIGTDGSILKLMNPQEEEPGWYALSSGKLDSFFKIALDKGTHLSLLVSSGDNDSIDELVNNPSSHAKQFVADVAPLLKQYRFSDLNLDIEYTKDASPTARTNFTTFVQTVRTLLDPKVSITVDITGDDLLRNKLIDPSSIGKISDYIVLMAYDYHYPGSFVTGAVAPLAGVTTNAEYDVTTAVEKALTVIPSEKIILGVPLYGYEWETLNTVSRSAVIPGTGVIASNHRAEQFVASCATCSAEFNQQDQEMHVWYKDELTGTIHQMFYPDIRSTHAKITLAHDKSLGGVAVWALGYEGDTILDPLKQYK